MSHLRMHINMHSNDSMTATLATGENPAESESRRRDYFNADEHGFWKTYVTARPKYPPELLLRVLDFHSQRGEWDNAHDLATGPGIVAFDLAKHFAHTTGSDVAPSAIEYCKEAYGASRSDVTFRVGGAEDIESFEQECSLDLVTIGEAIPIMDVATVVRKVARVLKPGGTLAFWFYARPIFLSTSEGGNGLRPDTACNAAYQQCLKIAMQATNLRVHGDTRMPFMQNSFEHQLSGLDDIELPSSLFSHVERHKWNIDLDGGIVFCPPDVLGLEEKFTRRVGLADKIIEMTNLRFFAMDWSAQDAQSFLSTTMATMHDTDWESEENAPLTRAFEQAMGGQGVKKRAVFPAVLVMASKKR